MSDGLPDITINLSDPDDVRAHLPAAQEVASELRQRARELADRAERWDQLVSALEALAPALPESDLDGDGGERDTGPADDGVAHMDEMVGRPTMAQISEFIGEESNHEIRDESFGPPAWPSVDGLFVGH
jgi:hypothetical protein